MKKVCSTCRFWKRDGIDGACFVIQPEARIFTQAEVNDGLVFVRPRTNPNDPACLGWESDE